MASYDYIKNDGGAGVAEGATAEEAIANAKDRAASSGVALRAAVQQGNAGGTTSTTTPTGTNTESATGGKLTDRYKSDRKKIEDTYSIVEKPDEKAIRMAANERAQSLVNAVNAKYASIEAQDNEAIDLMNRERRAANVLSGLSGSKVGAGRSIATANEGATLKKKTAQEKAAEVAAIYTNAETRATEEFQKEREAYLSQQKDRLAAEQALGSRIKEEATAELTSLAASKSFEDFKKESPNLVRQYMEELGVKDETALKALFIKASGDSWEKIKDVEAGGKQVFIYRNPYTGDVKTEEVDLPGDGFKFVPSIGADGGWVNEETGEVKWVTTASRSGKGSDGGGDLYSPDDERLINRAGLRNADERVRSIFVDAPSGYRDAASRNGWVNTDTTPEELISSIEEWERVQKNKDEEGLFD